MATPKQIKRFLDEADEKIPEFNKALLSLEKNPEDFEAVKLAMRAAHTLKSSSAATNFMDISHLMHAMEDVLDRMRVEKQVLTKDEIDLLFKSVDTVAVSIQAIKDGKEEIKTTALIKKLKAIVSIKDSDSSKDTGDEIELQGELLAENPETMAEVTSIKVGTKTIDQIMKSVEALLIERMKLSETVLRGRGEDEDESKREIDFEEVLNISETLDRLSADLQAQVTEMRMVPLGQIFDYFPRMVRDLAKTKGKKIEFTTEGHDIELDRTVVDKISEPIIHLLRNAVDHGVEEEGTIRLRSKRLQDKVVIEIENSGNAIDWQAVVNKAVKSGRVNNGLAKKYLESIPSSGKASSELMDLLFEGGSTNTKVTETSGRGVGLQIVRKVISGIGGNVYAESVTKGGTRFVLELPLTLAIIKALLFLVGDITFAVPASQVDRSVSLSAQDLKKVLNQEAIVIGTESIPLIRLKEFFDLNPTNAAEGKELVIIVKREDGTDFGLVVDELLSEQDIVVKPLKGVLQQSKGFGGVTFLGNGRPAPILDIETLISSYKSDYY